MTRRIRDFHLTLDDVTKLKVQIIMPVVSAKAFGDSIKVKSTADKLGFSLRSGSGLDNKAGSRENKARSAMLFDAVETTRENVRE